MLIPLFRCGHGAVRPGRDRVMTAQITNLGDLGVTEASAGGGRVVMSSDERDPAG
jgi:hypothetical protein